MLRSLVILFAAFFLAGAVACGGDDDSGSSSAPSGGAPAASGGSDDGGDDATPDDEGDESDDDPQPVDSGGSSGGEVGHVVADGQRFSVSQVIRCEAFFEGEDNLDLQAVASDGIILFVTLNTPSAGLTEQEVSIQGGGLGVFGARASSPTGDEPWFDGETDAELLAPLFAVIGDRVTGLVQLLDPRGSGDTLDVSFEISIPADIIDC
jgi:hypothetical protein